MTKNLNYFWAKEEVKTFEDNWDFLFTDDLSYPICKVMDVKNTAIDLWISSFAFDFHSKLDIMLNI